MLPDIKLVQRMLTQIQVFQSYEYSDFENNKKI